MDRFTLIHTGDVHLGMSGEAFGARAAEHRQLLREAFTRVVDQCLAQPTNLLVIAGDLFDGAQPSRKTVEFVRAQLGRLGQAGPGTEVVILPGTHDPLTRGSVYEEWLRQGLPEHIHLLTDPKGRPVALAGREVLVHGGPGCLHLAAEDSAPFNIGVIHASLQLGNLLGGGEPALTPRNVADTRMNYLALGHWHRFGDYSTGGVTALYSGSPEITAIDQAERGQAVRVELSRGGLTRHERLPVGQLRREETEANLADYDNAHQLVEALRRQGDQDLVLEVVLTGLADPSFHYDAAELEEALGPDFFRVRVRDKALLAQEEITESRYPPELIVGRFVRLMRGRIETAREAGDEKQVRTETQALQWGLALLERKESA